MSGVAGGVVVLAGFTAPSGIQEVVQLRASQIGGGSPVTVTRSVTAGKTTYVTDICFNQLNGFTTYVEIRDNGTVLWRNDGASGSPFQNGKFSFVVPLEITTTLELVVSAYSQATITGFEQ